MKSVKQPYSPDIKVVEILNVFRSMVNDCIEIGIRTNASSLKRLSCLSYRFLGAKYDRIPSYYRLTAISKAAGILAARKKSLRRGFPTEVPYLQKPMLVSCYRFGIKDGALLFSITNRDRIKIDLTKNTLEEIKGLEVRSFTVTTTSLSLSIRKTVDMYTPKSFVGVDRNASNVTYRNETKVLQFNLSKEEEIAETTRAVTRSFKRCDTRIRKVICSKYGRRRTERVNQILHLVSKNIVENARLGQSAIVFEDI